VDLLQSLDLLKATKKASLNVNSSMSRKEKTHKNTPDKFTPLAAIAILKQSKSSPAKMQLLALVEYTHSSAS